MGRSVLILGTDHRYQRRDPLLRESQHKEFASCLTRLVRRHGVRLLAEEYSTQALEEQGISKTTVARLAKALGIAHCYCDLDRQTRHSLRIFQEGDIRMKALRTDWTEREIIERIAQSHRARERFWLERLQEAQLSPVLFVCGADHAACFARLLRAKRWDVRVIAEHWTAS